MPVIPSTTATITVGNVGTTLGNATKNMGGFRGFGGSVPSSGAISMSQCQKIQYGVGYVNGWSLLNASNNRGTWGDTSITNGSSKTVSCWVVTPILNANWRNIFHVTSDGGNCCGANQRAPAYWIYPNGTTVHMRHSTAADGNSGGPDPCSITLTRQSHMCVVYRSGGNSSMYINGSLIATYSSGSTWTDQISTATVYAPAPWDFYSDMYINRLWFYPYAMTDSQVSSLYSSDLNVIGSAYTLTFSGQTYQSNNAAYGGWEDKNMVDFYCPTSSYSRMYVTFRYSCGTGVGAYNDASTSYVTWGIGGLQLANFASQTSYYATFAHNYGVAVYQGCNYIFDTSSGNSNAYVNSSTLYNPTFTIGCVKPAAGSRVLIHEYHYHSAPGNAQYGFVYNLVVTFS